MVAACFATRSFQEAVAGPNTISRDSTVVFDQSSPLTWECNCCENAASPPPACQALLLVLLQQKPLDEIITETADGILHAFPPMVGFRPHDTPQRHGLQELPQHHTRCSVFVFNTRDTLQSTKLIGDEVDKHANRTNLSARPGLLSGPFSCLS